MSSTNENHSSKQSVSSSARNKGLYKHIFENAPIGIIHYNSEGIVTECNDRFIEIIGSSKEQLVGLDMKSLPDQQLRETIKSALKGEISIYEGIYDATTSGKSVPVRAEFHPLESKVSVNHEGIGMVQDISERYYTTQRLRESEERYRTIFTNSNNVMLLIDIDSGKIKDANHAAENFYGWSRDELTNMYIRDINTLPADTVMREMDKVRETNKNVFYFKHRLASGEIRDVEVYSGLVKIEGEHYLNSIINDISERMKAERELKKFKLGIERSSNVVFITDKDGIIEYVNPSFTQLYGYSYDEAVGENPRILKSGFYDKDHYKEFWEAITSGNVMEGEIINRTKEGKFVNIRLSSNPIINDEDEIVGFIAIQEDITEQKKRDEELKESLKEKEILLSEIHHRVKNNLAIISGLLELNLYQEEKSSTEEIIKDSQLRIKAMANVHEMLYESDSFSNISFSKYIDGLIESISNSFKDHNFTLNVKKNIEEVDLNVNQAIPCGLILNELITNALKHAFKRRNYGTVQIDLHHNQGVIELKVEDDGTGIPDDKNPLEFQSLGLTLIKILSQQLDADLDIGNSEKGFMARITFEPKVHLKGSSTSYF
jgi:PAS domain S-box-containing protein